MPLDPKLLYNNAPSVADNAATLGAFLLKHGWVSMYDEQLDRAPLSTTPVYFRAAIVWRYGKNFAHKGVKSDAILRKCMNILIFYPSCCIIIIGFSEARMGSPLGLAAGVSFRLRKRGSAI